jgi:hypothetical protein
MTRAIRKIQNRALFCLLVTVTACTNVSEYSNGLNTTGTTSTTASSSTTYTQVLLNANIQILTTTTANQTPSVEVDLSVDPSQAGFSPLTNYCGTGTTNPCDCELDWNEVNTAGGITQTYLRTKKLPTVTVAGTEVKCDMDQSFYAEIPTGTTIQLSIVPEVTNLTGINTQPIGYKKGTLITSNGDFLDNTLTPFLNIHRYTCVLKRQASYEILNQYSPSTSTSSSGTSTTNPNAILGSQFCSGATGVSPSASCATPRNGPSAQSYYRNLYVQSTNRGSIVSSNSYYDCPSVAESIITSAGQAAPTGTGTIYPQWPLDTTFALATTWSSDWSVGIRAGSMLFVNGNQYTQPSACTNDTSPRLDERGIAIQCMGYAKKPNSDGTCGTITDSNGRIRPLTRLRRYRTLYPTTYQANGDIDTGMTEADEVYVADRLVVNSQGVPTGDMIYGPKPCNFSWFDHEGVVNRKGLYNFGSGIQGDPVAVGNPLHYAKPSYVATSNYQYSGTLGTWSVNPDGLIFPNSDHDGAVGTLNNPSCSATLPVVEETLGSPSMIRLLTINRSRTDSVQIGSRVFNLRELPVKPVDPWMPIYQEDTSLQACVPLADPYLEPPMYFYERKDDTSGVSTMEYCAKAYPTQNPYWVQLNSLKSPTSNTISARVVNFPAAGAVPAGTPYAQVSIFTSHNNTSAAPTSATHYLDAANYCFGTKETAICTMTLGAGSTSPTNNDCASYLKTDGLTVNALSFLNDPGTKIPALAATTIPAYVRNTCDRTVVYDSDTTYFGFPLQATDPEISNMLYQDWKQTKSFSCQYSVSTDATKVNAQIPSSGCCGVYNGTAILSPILNVVSAGANGTAADGHLEPYTNPATPSTSTVRFCGNPVQ